MTNKLKTGFALPTHVKFQMKAKSQNRNLIARISNLYVHFVSLIIANKLLLSMDLNIQYFSR